MNYRVDQVNQVGSIGRVTILEKALLLAMSICVLQSKELGIVMVKCDLKAQQQALLIPAGGNYLPASTAISRALSHIRAQTCQASIYLAGELYLSSDSLPPLHMAGTIDLYCSSKLNPK